MLWNLRRPRWAAALTLGAILLAARPGWAAPAERTFTASDGVRLAYLEAGRGKRALVFVPGWLMPAEIFERQMQEFAADYRVLALSPRSQGRSDLAPRPVTAERRARDIYEFLAAAHVAGDFILVGWSLGVMEALDFEHRFNPPGLKALVLIDNSIGEGKPAAPSTYLNALKSPEKREPFLKGFVRTFFTAPPSPDLLAKLDASALRPSGEAALELLRKPYPREYYRDEIYAHPQRPVLYAVTPRFADQADALLARHPTASVSLFEGAGHALFFDRAPLFNARLRAFLATLP
jgi:microsomal epoxide hydrolase